MGRAEARFSHPYVGELLSSHAGTRAAVFLRFGIHPAPFLRQWLGTIVPGLWTNAPTLERKEMVEGSQENWERTPLSRRGCEWSNWVVMKERRKGGSH